MLYSSHVSAYVPAQPALCQAADEDVLPGTLGHNSVTTAWCLWWDTQRADGNLIQYTNIIQLLYNSYTIVLLYNSAGGKIINGSYGFRFSCCEGGKETDKTRLAFQSSFWGSCTRIGLERHSKHVCGQCLFLSPSWIDACVCLLVQSLFRVLINYLKDAHLKECSAY